LFLLLKVHLNLNQASQPLLSFVAAFLLTYACHLTKSVFRLIVNWSHFVSHERTLDCMDSLLQSMVSYCCLCTRVTAQGS
jgi:hypothetical protein